MLLLLSSERKIAKIIPDLATAGLKLRSTNCKKYLNIKIQYFHSDPDTENGGYLQSVLNVNKTKCALRYDSVNRERKKSDANKLEEVEKLG